jgi:hypothetical protein
LGLPKGQLLIRHAHFRTPIFGTFPMPPTIAGMAGQRVFNGSDGATGVDHSVGLWRIIHQFDGDGPPSKAEVREAAMNLDRDAIDRICSRLDVAARTNASRGKPGASAWYAAKQLIQQERRRSI